MEKLPKKLGISVSNNVRTIISENEGYGILTLEEFQEVIRRCEAYPDIKAELRASDNWLHRLLKSCVIFLDDGDVTKRAVEKQSRYNKQALKEKP